MGLKGVEKHPLDPLSFQEAEEVFPEVAGGLQATDDLIGEDLSWLKGFQDLLEPFGRGVDGEAFADFFSLSIEKSRAMRFQADIDTDLFAL